MLEAAEDGVVAIAAANILGISPAALALLVCTKFIGASVPIKAAATPAAIVLLANLLCFILAVFPLMLHSLCCLKDL